MRAALSRRNDLDFAAVCEDHLDDVFGYLLYLTGNRTVAEDLAADTFERALRRFRRYDPRRGTPRRLPSHHLPCWTTLIGTAFDFES